MTSKQKFKEIKANIQYGDYNILQEVLNAKTVAAARQRFLREDSEAVKAMQFIQQNRKELPEKFQQIQN